LNNAHCGAIGEPPLA